MILRLIHRLLVEVENKKVSSNILKNIIYMNLKIKINTYG